jgi:phosphoadenosine phosphosulfate reductase
VSASTLEVSKGRELEAKTLETIRWALATYSGLLMTSGFNLNGTVLIDLAVRAGFRGELVFVDTLAHFPETLRTRDEIAARYPEVTLITLTPAAQSSTGELPVCGAAECCTVRKVLPLRRFLETRQPSAILSARSRFQSETRAILNTVEDAGDYVKVNPLVAWSQGDLERYARAHGLPVNPLYWQGFLSIGCAPTTRAVRAGEDVRAGRWAGQAKTECGLWWGEKAL